MIRVNSSYQPVDWSAPEKIGAVFTTRIGGNSDRPFDSFNLAMHVGDSELAVSNNRDQLLRDQQLDTIAWLNQVHGVEVAEAHSSRSAMAAVPIADACYTGSSGVACAVLVADCMPVMVTDKKGSCVGIAHAGWRGLCEGVVPNLISNMQIDPKQAIAWLGPCIGPKSFEVGPEVLEAFQSSASFQSLDVNSGFAKGKKDRYMGSLTQLAKMQLESLGVQNIFASQECTYEQSQKYFSYRRDGSSGRMAALIWIK